MNITRFEPWSLINKLHRDLGYADPFFASRFGYTEDSDQSVANWVPAVDIIEASDRFILRADLPGVNADEIDISMEKDVLSISGERRQEKTDDVEGMQRLERVTGKFYRRFTLPETVDSEGISARSVNGILEVSIPKQPEVKARRITVQAA